jgi:hypothetical protein
MLHEVAIVLYALAAGFTASAIVTNLYRLVATKPQTETGKTVYMVIMVVAGPSVLLENAAKSFRAKGCPVWAFWLATAVAGYWSFALGLFVLNIGLAL